jgi:hypothetical protein
VPPYLKNELEGRDDMLSQERVEEISESFNLRVSDLYMEMGLVTARLIDLKQDEEIEDIIQESDHVAIFRLKVYEVEATFAVLHY